VAVPRAPQGGGYDDTVATESPFMTGASVDSVPCFHGKLLSAAPTVDLIVRTLAAGRDPLTDRT
jgi:hypothetical protein